MNVSWVVVEVDHGQDTGKQVGPIAEQFDTADRRIRRRPTAVADPVAVIRRGPAVDAHADPDVEPIEEVQPVVVEQHAVGLQLEADGRHSVVKYLQDGAEVGAARRARARHHAARRLRVVQVVVVACSAIRCATAWATSTLIRTGRPRLEDRAWLVEHIAVVAVDVAAVDHLEDEGPQWWHAARSARAQDCAGSDAACAARTDSGFACSAAIRAWTLWTTVASTGCTFDVVDCCMVASFMSDGDDTGTQ